MTDLAPVGEGIGTVRDHSTVGSPETLSITKCTVAMRSDWQQSLVNGRVGRAKRVQSGEEWAL